MTPLTTHPQITFAQLGVREEIVRALTEQGIEHAFAIQELTLPLALSGNDLIGQARTGMGKTFAFGVPLLQRITTDTTRQLSGIPRALVVVPTRELCIQVFEDLTGAELRRRIAEEMLEGEEGGKLALTLLTFGFKNGPPRDSDLTLDVRFLPNPHYDARMRPMTGLDQKVREFVEAGTQAGEFYGRLMPLLDFLIPAYVAEGKSHLTIAIGCTGGRHRSVTVAERLWRDLSKRDDVIVRVSHRDLV